MGLDLHRDTGAAEAKTEVRFGVFAARDPEGTPVVPGYKTLSLGFVQGFKSCTVTELR